MIRNLNFMVLIIANVFDNEERWAKEAKVTIIKNTMSLFYHTCGEIYRTCAKTFRVVLVNQLRRTAKTDIPQIHSRVNSTTILSSHDTKHAEQTFLPKQKYLLHRWISKKYTKRRQSLKAIIMIKFCEAKQMACDVSGDTISTWNFDKTSKPLPFGYVLYRIFH